MRDSTYYIVVDQMYSLYLRVLLETLAHKITVFNVSNIHFSPTSRLSSTFLHPPFISVNTFRWHQVSFNGMIYTVHCHQWMQLQYNMCLQVFEPNNTTG